MATPRPVPRDPRYTQERPRPRTRRGSAEPVNFWEAVYDVESIVDAAANPLFSFEEMLEEGRAQDAAGTQSPSRAKKSFSQKVEAWFAFKKKQVYTMVKIYDAATDTFRDWDGPANKKKKAKSNKREKLREKGEELREKLGEFVLLYILCNGL